MHSSETLARTLTALVGTACVVNALVMMFLPMQWYGALPTVRATGPANHHLIVDVGLAYLASGLLLAFAAWSPSSHRGALIAGALWLALHGAFHVVELLTGEAPLDRLLFDAPAVLGPPLLLIVSLPLARRSVRAG